MCGIAGIIDLTVPKESFSHRILAMQKTLIHRGPDDAGSWVDNDLPVAFGHQRLAIIDPEQGKQPMTTTDGALTIIFNGAIYNYLELRQTLIARGYPIHSHSDTEVLLYAYREWGEKCLDHLLGMFAFAIWDQRHRRLFCARDRIGIKPFYYYFTPQQFIFGSEIKAILASGAVKANTNPQALKDYLTFQFCADEKTLFQHIVKLLPGHYLTVDLNDPLQLQVKQYWDLQYEIDHDHNEAWFIDNLNELVQNAIQHHLRADVPVGAHLSGGLDSSVVVAHAAHYLKNTSLSTFTGAFAEGPAFDETHYAKQVAQHVGAKYHEITIPAQEFSTVLPKLIYLMDEPVAGPGLIPQYYVSQLAAKQVKVVLGGQGGDEIFIGYVRYMLAHLERALLEAIEPSAIRAQDSITLKEMIPHLTSLQNYQPMLQKFWHSGLFDPPDQRYFKLIDRRENSATLIADEILQSAYSPFSAFSQIFNREGIPSVINKMLYFDLKASLPALLQVEDRTSMAASIESRVPLLDHRIIEFMAKVPPNIKFSQGRMKHLLKEASKDLLPTSIIERKDKMGFNTPLAQWVNGSAKEFVRDLMTSRAARERELYNMPKLQQALDNPHECGRLIWGVLCLELWHTLYIDGNHNVS